MAGLRRDRAHDRDAELWRIPARGEARAWRVLHQTRADRRRNDEAAMTILNITKAVRKGAHVIIALYGYSGSGKTLSALLLARGLAGKDGKICMIDTESGRGMIYAQAVPGGYDYAELTPPFTPERYTEAFAEVEATGAKVVIVDSSSHEWAGIGGIVEMADSGKSQAGVPLQGLVKWAGPKARHKRWIAALLQSHMHVILCVRAKEKLVQKGSGPRA